MKITYFAPIENMGDNVTESDAEGYRGWALSELAKEFPEAEIEVSDEQSIKTTHCTDENRQEEAEEFCSRLWDRCPWSWVSLDA